MTALTATLAARCADAPGANAYVFATQEDNIAVAAFDAFVTAF